MVRCHKCGWEWTLPGQPGRNDGCHQCHADLKVCLNCAHYDPRSAHQCREGRADPVGEKHQANFCEYFEMARRVWSAPDPSDSRADAARSQLKKLFGD